MQTQSEFYLLTAGQTVDVATTLKLLNELRQGYLHGRELVTVGDEDKPVYRIGEAPNNYADENPIYEGRPLRPDGTCDQTNRSWEGVSLEVRQLVRLAVKSGELSPSDAHDAMDMAVSPEAAKKLRSRYKKASIRYNELRDTGDLPKLKIALGERRPVSGRPFEKGKKVMRMAQPIVGGVMWTLGRDGKNFKAFNLDDERC